MNLPRTLGMIIKPMAYQSKNTDLSIEIKDISTGSNEISIRNNGLSTTNDYISIKTQKTSERINEISTNILLFNSTEYQTKSIKYQSEAMNLPRMANEPSANATFLEHAPIGGHVNIGGLGCSSSF